MNHVFIAKLSLWNEVILFIREHLFERCCSERRAALSPMEIEQKLPRWYHVGRVRMNDELDIVRLVKNIRTMRIMLREHSHNEDLRLAMEVSRKNLIELDSSSEDDYIYGLANNRTDITIIDQVEKL